LRYESTQLDVQYSMNPDADFKKDYSNFVPSATLTYQLNPARNFGVYLSYRFGEMKQQIKKAIRGITNDDSMGGGQGGGQSSSSSGRQN